MKAREEFETFGLDSNFADLLPKVEVCDSTWKVTQNRSCPNSSINYRKVICEKYTAEPGLEPSSLIMGLKRYDC